MKKKMIQAVLLSMTMISLIVSVAPIEGHDETNETDVAAQTETTNTKGKLLAGITRDIYGSISSGMITKEEFKIVETKSMLVEPDRLNKELEERLNSIQANDKKIYYLEYKTIIDEYSSSQYCDQLNLPSTVYDCYSYDEIIIFQKLLSAETTGGDFNSKCNVASVVWNRLNSDKYPNTIKEVIYQRNGGVQFSPTADGRINTVEITEDDILAIEYTFLFGSTAYDCIAFDNVKGSSWNKNNLEYVFTDSINHSFYR